MTDQDKVRFLKLMRMLYDANDREWNENQAVTYWTVLIAHDIKEIENAIMNCIETGSFPKVSDIKERLAGSTKRDAEEALAIVYERLYRGNLYRNYQLLRNGKPDMVLMQTIQDMGGMLEANEKILTSWKWRQDFAERYIANARHPEMCHAVKTVGADESSAPIQIELTGNKTMALPGVEQAALEAAV